MGHSAATWLIKLVLHIDSCFLQWIFTMYVCLSFVLKTCISQLVNCDTVLLCIGLYGS